MTTVDLDLAAILDLANDCLRAAGADEANARAVADTVMRAERDGSVSHGLFRIPGYVASLKSGKVNGNADPILETITPVVLRCDGRGGFAPLALGRCVGPLAASASTYGIAVLALTNSHHFAALWPETEALAGQGLVALSCLSYLPSVAPAGGQQALFGTNPISFAWPRSGANPVVFDMATAAMAKGEVQIAARDGHEVPSGTGLDHRGAPTSDPREILKGVLLPFGGHKGSAVALMVELLAGPLLGEVMSFEAAGQDNKDGGPPRGGQFLLAIDPRVVAGQGHDWAAQSEQLFQRMEAMKGVRLPGARRHRNRQDDGPRAVNASLVAQLRAMVSA